MTPAQRKEQRRRSDRLRKALEEERVDFVEYSWWDSGKQRYVVEFYEDNTKGDD